MQEEEEPRERRRGVTVKEIQQPTTEIFVVAPRIIFGAPLCFFFLFAFAVWRVSHCKKAGAQSAAKIAAETELLPMRHSALA